MASSRKELPSDIVHVILALIPKLVPPVSEVSVEGIEQNVIRDLGRILFEFPKIFRFLFLTGIRLFEWLPVLFGFGFTRFSRLSGHHQERYIENWANSQIIIKREFFKTIKGGIMLTYFADRRVWKYIGYDPDPHMAGRIQLRKEILERG